MSFSLYRAYTLTYENWKNDESEKLLKKNANDMKNVLSRFDCCHFNAARIIFLIAA